MTVVVKLNFEGSHALFHYRSNCIEKGVYMNVWLNRCRRVEKYYTSTPPLNKSTGTHIKFLGLKNTFSIKTSEHQYYGINNVD